MNNVDKELLYLIQRDSRITTAELADKVGLSPSPVARRLRLLEDQGFIEGYRAHLSKSKLGLNITTFVHVRLKEHQDAPVMAFESAVSDMAAVVSCHTVSGAFDYLLQVLTADLVAYEQWVRELQRLPMVSQVDSSFAIREVKNQQALPI
ncbi:MULTISPECIES: Lrp/AsnC family transcriptional regulator [unclassified Agarivorans]|uniref:Lrp/AsnC family transcriptional regulator n=1 Tax=unclassified Agarivorans TaxID=2636026 RepID=UPI0026E15F54|nr:MULTISPECIES: Lrp/AsnC family transcriptional regulator [unclassified Agarivorans]MDO6685277.1 Lrp/AsnC family transcriptional regulator [Agarivorans sp. 3_MG-2023]MDO6715551.1 Lrp/AsnC family transcriptional regulator [Agarivorans sp. 2_MG-2023]